MSRSDLMDLAERVASGASRAGAEGGEAFLSRRRLREIRVRRGRLERVTESENTGCGLRVRVGGRSGFASTTDMSPEGIGRVVEMASAVARRTPEDPHGELPDPSGQPAPDLDLEDRSLLDLDFEKGLELARRAEAAALEADSSVQAGEGSGFADGSGEVAVASTTGVRASYRGTHCSLSSSPVAVSGDSRQRQYWYESRRHMEDLPSPEQVGAEAGRRAARMLGARPVRTGRYPVVLDPLEGARFWADLSRALLGDAARRGVSFLASEMGRLIASDRVTLVEDPTAPRAPGARPWDGEGCPTSRRVLIDRGRLVSWLYDTRTARMAGARSTGSAVRGYAGTPSPGAHAPRLDAGMAGPGEILAAAGRGLYVTQMIGFGMNLVTGDFSRGASGWWFEEGEYAYPVQEVTLSGNLREMLKGIRMVGEDLVLRSAANSPTFLVEGMVVSGGGGAKGASP